MAGFKPVRVFHDNPPGKTEGEGEVVTVVTVLWPIGVVDVPLPPGPGAVAVPPGMDRVDEPPTN